MRNATALAALALLGCSLGGCAFTDSLGFDDILPKKPDVYDQPVRNNADRREPFVQRLRYPIPDDSWNRENGSEVEPWDLPRK